MLSHSPGRARALLVDQNLMLLSAREWLDEAIKSTEGSPPLSSLSLGWRGVTALRREHGPAQAPMPALADDHLIIDLKGTTEVRYRVDGGQERIVRTTAPGSITYVPRGVSVDWATRDRSQALHLLIAPSVVDAAVAELSKAGLTSAPEVFAGRKSSTIERLGFLILQELQTPSPGGSLYADSLAQAIAVELIRTRSLRRDQPQTHGRKLSRAQLDRAISYMQEHLHTPIGLDEIAAAAGVSRFHFARGFRNELGASPVEYLVQIRIDRAKAILAGSDLPIASVARECGFTNGRYFATVFGRATGLTPSAYRRLATE